MATKQTAPGARILPLLIAALVALLAAPALSGSWAPTAELAKRVRFDLLFRGGLVVDGSGGAPFEGTVAVVDGRLRLRPGAAPDWTAARDIDIAGRVIAPGFIDLHTHARADLTDPQRSSMLHYITQGVSTVVIGNDGGGTPHIAERFATIEKHGSGTHVVQYAGHAALRRAVMPRTDRSATASEIAAMQELLDAAMRQGAVGLSSGLFYADGSFATTEEMIELSRIAARHGGIYDSHIRSESSRGIGVLAAIDEALRIGREADIPVNIAHIKMLGRGVWGQASEAINRIEAARAAGQRVTADQYPWEASSTRLKSAVLSRRWQAGSDAEWRARLVDPQTRSAALKDMRENIHRRGGPASLLLLQTTDPHWSGLRLDEIARRMGLSPEEAAAALLARGSPGVVSFNMHEDDIAAFMTRPWVATSSDGTSGHPRKYGSFPRKYWRYVVEREVISLRDFVRASSALAADILGLSQRGYLRDGYHADLLIFDPHHYRERADYQHWDRLSQGVEYLFLEGTAVIDAGQATGARPGRGLRLTEQH